MTPATSRCASAGSFLSGAGGGMVTRSSCVALGHPLADDGDGFARILVGKLADLLHRLRVDLPLNLGDVDLPRGLAWLGFHVLDRAEGVRQLAACGQCG